MANDDYPHKHLDINLIKPRTESPGQHLLVFTHFWYGGILGGQQG